jgi:carboxypeptidase PM20D1
VEEGTESDWGKAHGCVACGPFSGAIHRGYVWGRGALDMKSTCVTFLHAAEQLLKRPRGFSPARSIYLAIGHDEETMGDGHRNIALALKDAGVELEVVLDEGNPTLQRGSIPLNTNFDLAMPALAEKGYLSLHLAVNLSAAEAGHAAYPPPSGTAITILTAALQRILAGQPAPTLRRPIEDLLRAVAPALPAPAAFVVERTVPTAAAGRARRTEPPPPAPLAHRPTPRPAPCASPPPPPARPPPRLAQTPPSPARGRRSSGR